MRSQPVLRKAASRSSGRPACPSRYARTVDWPTSAEAKAARLFLTLGERMGERDGETFFIPMALSRQELADLLGVTLETAIRLMSRWQKEGVVLTERNGFRVPSRPALREFADSNR